MSSTNNDAPLPIRQSDLDEYSIRVTALLTKVSWSRLQVTDGRNAKVSRMEVMRSAGAVHEAQHLSLIEIAQAAAGKEAIILPEEVNKSLLTLDWALRVGFHIKDLYTQFSGLGTLIQQGSESFTPEESTEFQQKQRTASAIFMFCAASYVVWELSRYKSDEIGRSPATIERIPEFSFLDANRAARCMLFYYGGALTSGVVHSAHDFAKMTLVYFERVLSEMKLCSPELRYADAFTRNHYKLEKEDFTVRGFEVEVGKSVVSIESRRVELGEIVGNQDAKHYARRIVFSLLCYDILQKLNPMVKLGGFTPINMGYGKPGTGKTMINAAIATLAHDLAKWLGIPFVYHPLPDTIISTFQGGSAERFMEWFQPLNDPTKLFYAPIDDAENIVASRTRQGSSEGERGVIGSFLRNSEGAYAIIRGNWVIDLFTNIPDQLDPAVLSRVLRRFLINGAEDVADFLDQDWLWWSKHAELDSSFVDMVDPDGHVWMATQKQLATLSEVYIDVTEPKEARVRAVYDRVLRKRNPNQHIFYAELFHGILEEYPLFSSRDVRNVQRAIDARIMDFDFPEEWMDDPEVFFRKDYDTKLGMLIEMKKTNMKGLSFSEIRRQETVVYLDNMARIVDGEKDRRLTTMVEEIVTRFEANLKAQEVLKKRELIHA